MWRKILTVLVVALAAIIGYYATLPVPEGIGASPNKMRTTTAFYDIVSFYIMNNVMISCNGQRLYMYNNTPGNTVVPQSKEPIRRRHITRRLFLTSQAKNQSSSGFQHTQRAL